MKTLLLFGAALLVCVAICFHASPASGQVDGAERFRGRYIGIALPVGNLCTTERLMVAVDVQSDGKMTGQVLDFSGQQKAYVDGSIIPSGTFLFETGTNMSVLPPPPCFPFCLVNDPGSGWLVRGASSSRAGTMRGSLDARTRGGCRYTFTLYRRMRNN